ncbi:MAG: hypothetical protein EP343_31510 [Deltaproteobacteria bacterium]|nr:MAG: hypothetical protein EP343_31510 [Deltaproteobacteria bacterium]
MGQRTMGVLVLGLGLCVVGSLGQAETVATSRPQKMKSEKPKAKKAKPRLSAEEAKPRSGASRSGRTTVINQPVRYRRPYPYRSSDTVLENRDDQGYVWMMQCGAQGLQGKIGPDAVVRFRNRGTQAKPCKLSLQGGQAAFSMKGQKLLIRRGQLRELKVTIVPYPPVPFVGDGLIATDHKLARQWATSATASSEYTSGSWSAKRATGPADVTRCADSTNAWATKPANAGKEWLSLSYAQKVRAVGVVVHASYNPGAIVRIEAATGAGWTTVWQGNDPSKGTCPVKVAFRFSEVVDTNSIRIVLDTKLVSGWNEIDAVQLVSLPALP